MTLLPSTDFNIRGYEGKPYAVEVICAAPGCGQPSAHVHHIWPRSFLRHQPVNWVQLPDGTVIGNRTGLCLKHHNDVTGMIGGHKARIRFRQGVFWWEVKVTNGTDDVWTSGALLVYQPPGVSTLPTPQPPAEECPTCGHRKARTGLPRRKSKTWVIEVPDDAEIGSDVLDEWVTTFAATLGLDDERSRLLRYHALVTVFAWAIQHETEFAADVREAARA